jgi:sirohydrochlorin cobaltochelatase
MGNAIVLIGHGSRLPFNRRVVAALADTIRGLGRWDYVGYCFLEMERPTIPEALADACSDTSIEQVVFAPVFIASGAHIRTDIPRLLHMPEGRRSTRRIINGAERKVALSDPIGADKHLAMIIHRKALASIGR